MASRSDGLPPEPAVAFPVEANDPRLLERNPNGPSVQTQTTIQAMVFSTVGRGGLLVLDAFTGIICARLLGPSGRGELSALILWPVFLSGASTLGLPSALIYSLKAARSRSPYLISAAILLGSVLSILTALGGVYALPSWLSHYSPESIRHAQWFMLGAPLSMAALLFRAIWEADGRFDKSALAQILSRVGTLGGLLAIVLMHHLTPFTAALCYVFSGVVPFLWTAIDIVPRALWSSSKTFSASAALLKYGLRSYGIDLCGALGQYVDQALVLGMLTATEMGTYAVTLSVSRMLNVLSLSMAAVLFPQSVGQTKERTLSLVVRTTTIAMLLSLVGAFVIIFCGRSLLSLLYGPAYASAHLLLTILTLEAVISGCLNILSQPFMALGRPGTVTLLQVAGLLASVPLIIVLVPRYGSVGAAFSLLCSSLVRGALLSISYRTVFAGLLTTKLLKQEVLLAFQSMREKLPVTR